MAKVGDRVEVDTSKAGRRAGVVTRVSGRLMTIRWDTGEESTLSPGPGVLRVVGRGRAKAPARQRAKTTSTGSKTATTPSSPATKAASPTKTGTKKTGT